jgi:hypothetical protein
MLVMAFTTLQPLAIAVIEGCVLALDFLALATASRIVAGNVPAGGHPTAGAAPGGLVRVFGAQLDGTAWPGKAGVPATVNCSVQLSVCPMLLHCTWHV